MDYHIQAWKFWRKIDRRSPDECWLFLPPLHSTGYGRAWHEKRLVYAHRIAYQFGIGRIEDGLVLDHLCRNRACCNPFHLEPVSNRENCLRGVSFAAVNAAKTHCVQGHVFSSENTIIRPNGNRRCKACHTSEKTKRLARTSYARRKLAKAQRETRKAVVDKSDADELTALVQSGLLAEASKLKKKIASRIRQRQYRKRVDGR